MQIFLVGGAVRDELLGRPITERDWVVVGSTPEEMLAKGFQPVGKDFPVFLHPKTHEEYALARTERKTGAGYKGFHFYATPDVTLQEDLLRRDLTINAMAKNVDTGEIIDPYHGQQDIQHRILRHVSPAFSEDPVRILRVARFAAQLPEFHVYTQTNTLMNAMVKSGEIDALVSERVWKEWSRALIAKHPERFLEALNNCGALSVLFPALAKHTDYAALNRAVQLTPVGTIRFAALLHYLTIDQMKSLCQHYRVPNEYSDLAILTAKYHALYCNLDTKNAKQVWEILKSIDAFRRPERFQEWILTGIAIHPECDHTALLTAALHATKKVDMPFLLNQKLPGKAFAEALQHAQIQKIEELIKA